jgi:hypothetical protein
VPLEACTPPHVNMGVGLAAHPKPEGSGAPRQQGHVPEHAGRKMRNLIAPTEEREIVTAVAVARESVDARFRRDCEQVPAFSPALTARTG